MTALDDIELAATNLSNLITTFSGKDAAIRAALAAALAGTISPVRTIYLDTIGGSDTQTGAGQGTALKTLSAALALAGAGQVLNIVLVNDLYITAPQIAYSATLHFTSLTSSTRTIYFDPAGLDPTNLCNLNFQMGAVIVVTGVNLHILSGYSAAAAAGSCIRFAQGGNLVIEGGVVTVDAPASGGGNIPLLGAGARTHVQFNGVTQSSGAPGRIFAGVAAGADPNAAVGKLFTSNLTAG